MNRIIAVSIFPLLFVLACAVPSQAWIHGTASGPPPPGPTMQNVAVTFGNRTVSGYGGELLASQDLNYGTAVLPKGLDLVTTHVGDCIKYTTTLTSGTAGHFNLISHVASATAKSPTPTSAGVTAKLNGGPYVFLVQCEDSSNNVLASSNLTYNITTGLANNCGAVNLGDGDRVDIAYYPSGFASTLDGCEILFSTGFVKTSRYVVGMNFAHQVVVTWADTARPGSMMNFETGNNSQNVLVKDLSLTGPSIPAGVNYGLGLNGTGTVNAENITIAYNAAIEASHSYSCLDAPAPSATITGFYCDYVAGAFTVRTGNHFQTVSIRHGGGDYINFESATDCSLTDITLATPAGPQNPSLHNDYWQIKDGGTPQRCTMTRVMGIQAGGNLGAQTVFFGGGVTGANNDFTGYVSDSTCSGAAGQTLCVVTGGLQSNGTKSFIYSPSGAPFGPTSAIQVTCASTPCPFGAGTKYTLTGLGGNITYGSAGSPATFYGNQRDMNWDEIATSGFYVRGLSYVAAGGTSSFKHFTQSYEAPAGHDSCGSGCGPDLFFWTNTSNTNLYYGTLAIGPGMNYNGFNGTAPASATVSHVLNAANNTTTLATYYTNGDPEACLDAHSPAQWNAMTVQQMMVAWATCHIVKTGGPLDLGGGDYANAFTDAATPTWVDGTVVGSAFAGH